MPYALRLEHICISKFLSPLISYSNLNLNSAMCSNYLNRNEYITFFFFFFFGGPFTGKAALSRKANMESSKLSPIV